MENSFFSPYIILHDTSLRNSVRLSFKNPKILPKNLVLNISYLAAVIMLHNKHPQNFSGVQAEISLLLVYWDDLGVRFKASLILVAHSSG